MGNSGNVFVVFEINESVMTGSGSLLLIKFLSAGKILLGEETNVTFSDSDLTVSNLS